MVDEQTTGLVTGQWADPRAGKETFQAYAERWRTRQVHAPNTQDAFERILRVHVYPHIGGMRLDAVAPADIQELVRRWSDSAAPTTVEARYTIMATVFRGAIRDRILPASPCLDVRLPRIEPKSALVPISTETVLALHGALPPRYRAFLTLGAGTGMRRGELLGLTLDRVSVAFGTIRIDRQLARSSTSDQVVFSVPKTQASVRTIGVAEFLLDAVAAHVATYGTHRSGLVFTSEIGSPVGTSVLHRAWTFAAKQIGTEATPHDLRHYFASVQIAGGCSIKKLQQMLGHKSATETWDTYGHLIGDEDDRSRAVIQAVLGSRLQTPARADGGN